jgi:ubiquinone/menaquinone biosynthesis C-methylase UbiE
MQNKMMAGFKEAYRILKPNGKAVYNMSLVDDHDSENTKSGLIYFYPCRTRITTSRKK